MRSVLKLPAYRRLLGAYTLNELAWLVGSLTLAILVYRHTGSALGSAAFFLSSLFVPALISPLVVARLEQRSPHRVLSALYALQALAFLALAWVAGRFSLIPLLLIIMADGIAALTARSLVRAITVSVTSHAGLLREGNALTNTAFSICFMAGPALGGAVVAAGGTRVALVGNAGLLALTALTMITATGFRVSGAERTPTRGRVRAALAYARERPGIRSLLTVQAAALLSFTISIPVEVVLAERTLDAGAAGYGALLSAWGGGAIAGSAIYARWRRLAPRELIATGAGALGVGFIVMALSSSLAVAIVGAAVAGLGNGVEAVAARTALQEQVEQRWMAMIMSLNESMFQLVPGAGILLGGALAALAGPRVALTVAGIAALAVTAAVWIVLRPGGDPVESGDDRAGSEAGGAVAAT